MFVLQNSLLQDIWHNRTGGVVTSSMETVRNKFQDLLADYRCKNKKIFEIIHTSAGQTSKLIDFVPMKILYTPSPTQASELTEDI